MMLNIYGSGIGNKSLDRLYDGLKNNQSLIVLNLGLNLLNGLNPSKTISRILNYCLNIIELDISHNALGDVGGTTILDSICRLGSKSVV